jgi:AbiU2
VSQEQTSEETLEEFRKTYPGLVAEFAYHLWNAICHLNLSASAYSQLYSSKEAIEILNSSAPRFFSLLQYWLPWTIYLQIGRLTDPPQSGTRSGLRSNASFSGFVKVLREAGETAAADALDNDYKALQPAVQKIRNIRDRMLAHADLQTVLRKESPLPEVSHEELTALVDKIGKTYNRIDAHFRGKETYFEGMGASTGVDAVTLFLERGVKSFEEKN